ncbi:hypothetical protein KAR91_16505 [Candidatus Pacearchaeota archaeon]|nr:hypothetical protein [Candidatus Pacearchaeota archaeon]
MISENGGQEATLTLVGANRVQTIADENFVKGYSFSTRNVYPALALTNTYFHLDASALVGILQIVFEPLIFIGAEAGPMVVNLYVAPTLTAGGRTPLIVTPRRPGFVSQLIVEEVAAANVSAVGAKITGRLVSSSSAQGAGSDVGGASAGGLPFEIDNSLEYLVEVDNENGADGQIELNATWFEIPVPS